MMEQLVILLLIFAIWFLIAALLSPLEALGWWAGWFETEPDAEEHREALKRQSAPPGGDVYVVYLTGIGKPAGDIYSEPERNFLDTLKIGLDEEDIILIDDIFPYSVSNRALTGQRFFAWFWRLALRLKASGVVIGAVINLRNMFQVIVSADRRYGPIYNQGAAEMVIEGLKARGYHVDSGTPITLIGYSGGGQIALGAAQYIADALDAPVTVISLGGVMCSDPSLPLVEHLYHLHGEKDMVHRLGAILFPGRWNLQPHSYWNLAKEEGRITLVDMGNMGHTGAGGYLDTDTILLDGRSHLEKTVQLMLELIYEQDPNPNPVRLARMQQAVTQEMIALEIEG